MANKILYVLLKYNYDYYEFEHFIGIFETRKDAALFAESESDGEEIPVVTMPKEHGGLEERETTHYFILTTKINEGRRGY